MGNSVYHLHFSGLDGGFVLNPLWSGSWKRHVDILEENGASSFKNHGKLSKLRNVLFHCKNKVSSI